MGEIDKRSRIIAVNDKGLIPLLFFKNNEKLSLPGGCKEKNEKFKETAVRELLEETGIIIKGKLVKLRVFEKKTRKEVCFLGKAKKISDKKIKLTKQEEQKEINVLWLYPEEALKMLKQEKKCFQVRRDIKFLETFIKINNVIRTTNHAKQ
jgi:8-oxo-dGTP pyrophosphatase MutT (NUDIX family)